MREESYMDNKVCIGEAPVPERTMKDNIGELNSILDDCNCLLDGLIAFLWANVENSSQGIEIKSFDTALFSALDKGRYLKERLLSVNTRMGI